MSTTKDNTPDPRDDPEGFIREQFDGLEHVIDEVADGDFGSLSEDAQTIRQILHQDGGDDS